MIKIAEKRIYTIQEKLMLRVYHRKHKLPLIWKGTVQYREISLKYMHTHETIPICRFLNHAHEKPQESTGKPLAAPDVSREDKCKIKTKPIICISNDQSEKIKYK